jgi:hypothetical protein
MPRLQVLRRIAGEADAKRALKAILGHLQDYSATDADGAALQVRAHARSICLGGAIGLNSTIACCLS